MGGIFDWSEYHMLTKEYQILSSTLDELISQYIDGTLSLEDFNKSVAEIPQKLDETKSALDRLKVAVSAQQELARQSELFTYDEEKGLQLASLTDILANIVGSMINQFAQFEGIAAMFNPISTILKGFVDVLTPMLNALDPIAMALVSFGRLLGSLLAPLTPIIKAISWVFAALSYAFDQAVLFFDNLLGYIGLGFLSAEQRAEMSKSIEERTSEPGAIGSTTGTTFQAGSTQNITYNNQFTFKENYILESDDEAIRTLADLIIENLRERGYDLVVGG